MPTKTIADRSRVFAVDQKRRELCLALAEGHPAMLADAQEKSTNRWMWPDIGELEKVPMGDGSVRSKYELKLKGSRLRNVWASSMRQATSIPFDTQPTLDGWPEFIQGREDDPESGARNSLDDQGADLLTVWADAFWWKFVAGVHYLLSEAPGVGGSPYIVRVAASNLLDAKTRLMPGLAPKPGLPDRRHKLIEARLDMPLIEPAAPGNNPEEWPEDALVPRVRVYRIAELLEDVPDDGPCHFRNAEYRETANVKKWRWAGEWTPLEARRGVMREIPLRPFYGRYIAPYRGAPVGEDTASEQAGLWRSLTEYASREIKDARNLATIIGATPSDVMDHGSVIYLPGGEPGKVDMKLLETTGAALQALRDGHEATADSIQIGNLRAVLEKPEQVMTATEIRARTQGPASFLELSILQDQRTWQDVLTDLCILEGLETEGGTVELPHDFSQLPEHVEKLWDAHIQGGGTGPAEEDVYPEIQKAWKIWDGANIDEVAARARAIREESLA